MMREHYATYSAISATESLLDRAYSVGNFHVIRGLYIKNQLIINVGQDIPVAEPVAVTIDNGIATLFALDAMRELKQNSEYVLFLRKKATVQHDPLYATVNLGLGRFNTDGTDLEDEVGGRSWKEALRQELTAAYGVTFEVPTTVAPSLTSLSPASAAP